MSSLLNGSRLAPRRPIHTEQAGEDEAARRVRAERLRIARELHDVVAYGFATISLQAGVAAHVADERPEQARAALEAIRTASSDVLREMRAILGQLRQDENAPEPARGIGTLAALAETTTRAGVPTSLAVSGRPCPVPVAVDQAVYRIVQEALANVLRHARGAAASVSVVYRTRSLAVTIENDGTGQPAEFAGQGSGYGLVGMRERALALGGGLTAALRPEGGYSVHASFPIKGHR
jgi:signal transduction histidine kinase